MAEDKWDTYGNSNGITLAFFSIASSHLSSMVFLSFSYLVFLSLNRSTLPLCFFPLPLCPHSISLSLSLPFIPFRQPNTKTLNPIAY
ncbi:hypothetical protein Syun_028286 [Stephania yunnanensis]|uniref:Uncharacterized protein n=1 Tax=Stephania yunnanensis TaxID=152371 RepID=A0AAP0HRZ6_9MAGN